MKLIAVTLAVLSLLAVSTSAQEKAKLPFYFPKGVIQTTDPLKQDQEYLRYLASTWSCVQGNPNGIQELISEPDSIVVKTDIASTSSVTDPNTKMKIILDNYVKMPDGRIRVTTLCDQFFITPEQLQVVVDDLKATVVKAAADDQEFYGKISDLSVKARAAKLGIKEEDLRAQLDEKVPGYSVTFRELHRLPKPSKASDFVPRELHLGVMPEIPGGILGVTWLNTGIIYYNVHARVIDYIMTRPGVMSHEMVHVNINVEKFPMVEAFDAELMASIPEMLYAENRTDLPAHGYAKTMRELAEIYFNFDFAQMKKDIFKYDLAGNLVYDYDKLAYYHEQMQMIKAEMMAFFQNVTIPEFYSDPTWWSAVNNIRGDKNSVFRMTMALHYNPTLLGGSKETMLWLDAHKEEISTIAEKAFQAGLHPAGEPMFMDDTVSPALLARYESTFSAAQRARIEAFYTTHPEKLEQLKKLSPSELFEVLSKVKGQGELQ